MAEVHHAREYSLEFRGSMDNSPIGKMLRGAIDMHVHFSPEPSLGRRYNALEIALNAREAGLTIWAS